MKLIFSRKGFDSGSGGMASPILPDGSLYMLPIPDAEGRIRYSQIQHASHNLGELVAQLSAGRLSPDLPAHLDPDLYPDSLPRLPGWRPIFGQCGAAQTHLLNLQVQAGDIFLFFGWYRHTQWAGQRLQFRKEDKEGRHVIFGWLQIGQVLPVSDPASHPDWSKYHPHLDGHSRHPNDTLYLASEALSLPGLPAACRKGSGSFPCLSDKLVLSQAGASRSIWKLPGWFYPASSRKPLSYHAAPDRWTLQDDGSVILKSVGRGQEFVLDCADYPEAIDWLAGLINLDPHPRSEDSHLARLF